MPWRSSRLGDLTLNATMLVLPEKTLTNLGEPIDGIIGSLDLKQMAVLFDFQARQITLISGGPLTPGLLQQLQMAQASVIPVIPTAAPNFEVSVRINDQVDLAMVIDTGGATTGISQQVVRQLAPPVLPDRQTVTSLYGPVSSYQVRVKSLALGSQTLSDLALASLDRDYPPVPSLLGLDVLANFRLLLDYPAGKLYLQRVAAPLGPKALNYRVPLIAIPGDPGAYVQVVLQDHKSYLFILDPLIPNTFIDGKAAAALGVPTETLKSGKETFLMIHSDMDIGPEVGVTLENVPIAVGDLSELQKRAPALAGVVGLNLLQHYALRFDARDQTVTFLDADAMKRLLPTLQDYVQIPLQIEEGLYRVSAQVDGVPAHLFLSLFSKRTALLWPKLRAALKPQATLVSAWESRRYLRLHSLVLGDFTWRDPIVAQFAVDDPSLPDSNLLSRDVLEGYDGVVDFPGSRLYLRRERDAQAPLEFVGIGLQADRTSEGKLAVAGLDAPSPAQEAGLEVGDTIVSVNGMSAATMSVATFLAQTTKPEGSVIVVVVQRKGETKTREVKLVVRKLL